MAAEKESIGTGRAILKLIRVGALILCHSNRSAYFVLRSVRMDQGESSGRAYRSAHIIRCNILYDIN